MKIWIIAEGEPLPCTANPRLMRMGLLAKYLAENGHDVIWWSSTFVHGTKEYWANEYTDIEVEKNERLLLLHSKISYKKNVSLKRIRYHHILAKEFRRHCEDEEKPDVILCSYPTAQFAYEANRYGKKNNVPVILDARDLWPDIFTRAFPQCMEKVAKIALTPLQSQAKRVFRNADVVIGVVPSSVEWGLKKAGRAQGRLDQCIYIGYNTPAKTAAEQYESEKKQWKELGVTEDTWNLCFVGTMSSNSLDILTCIRAVKRMSKQYPQLRLVFCGDGDGMKLYRQEAGECENIVFGGWCNDNQIQSLFDIGNAGLYSYRNLEDFKEAFGNKIIAYMAAGLPVLSSLTGFSKSYMERYQMGIVYDEGSENSFIQKLEWMIAEPEKLEKMGKHAKERFDIDFDADVVNKKFETLLIETVQQGKRG